MRVYSLQFKAKVLMCQKNCHACAFFSIHHKIFYSLRDTQVVVLRETVRIYNVVSQPMCDVDDATHTVLARATHKHDSKPIF